MISKYQVLLTLLGCAVQAQRLLAGGKGGGGLTGEDEEEEIVADEGGDEEEAMETPSSDVLKGFTTVLIIVCSVVCITLFAIDYYKREFREKKDLIAVMGLCLA